MDADVALTVRVPASLRDAFSDACKSSDTNPSREVRRIMREYIAQHGQTSLFGKPAARKSRK